MGPTCADYLGGIAKNARCEVLPDVGALGLLFRSKGVERELQDKTLSSVTPLNLLLNRSIPMVYDDVRCQFCQW